MKTKQRLLIENEVMVGLLKSTGAIIGVLLVIILALIVEK